MNANLVLSFRFLSPWFHGRGDAGAPDWPPSPMRVYQALVAASARAGILSSLQGALAWLEQRDPPRILAPEGLQGAAGYRLSVPHNAMDRVARDWCRGQPGDAAKHRALKDVRPLRLAEDAAVHYVWTLRSEETSTASALVAAARAVVALGWGLDLVVGDGAVVDAPRLAKLSERMTAWEPRSDGRRRLRTPVAGTLADLQRRHASFLVRTSLADPTLRPPPALSAFAITPYARAGQPPTVEVAGFTMMRVDSLGFRAFDAARSVKAIAGMLRHAVRTAAERAGWDEARVAASVLGHGRGDEPRLLLVPVPSVEPRGEGREVVGAVRRVMLYTTDPDGHEAAWAAHALGGMDLIEEGTGEVQAVLAAAPPDDRVLGRYLSESRTWVSATPIVLPGFDDRDGLRARLRLAKDGSEQRLLLGRLGRRREALVRKALLQAGLGEEIASSADIAIRETGFVAGVENASRYAVPRHLAGTPRFHLRLRWPQPVPGPLCIGRGRFSGMGLLVAVND